MVLINITMASTSVCRSLIPWTVETELTFTGLFQKIAAGAHPRLVVEEELSHSRLDKVYVGTTKDSLSLVDEQLVVGEVCQVFGQHVKLNVSRLATSEEPTSQPLANAFTVLMNNQRILDAGKKLPTKTVVKDELFNDLNLIF